MQSIICFISDFGLDDTWVGVCHAVIHRACPQAHIVDLGHNIPPFDTRKGAATAAAGVYQIPDAIHLVVVDPGVGAGRRNLCLATKSGALLVGPDNGVLMPAADRGGGVELAIEIDSSKIDFRSPLATFHARDVLAPAAAALACGVDARSLGHPVAVSELVAGPFGRCVGGDGAVACEVIDVDRFGSVRFNISAEELEPLGLKTRALGIAAGHTTIEVPFGATFADVREGEPVMVIDSSGWLTLALNKGSALERYGIEVGSTATVRGVH